MIGLGPSRSGWRSIAITRNPCQRTAPLIPSENSVRYLGFIALLLGVGLAAEASARPPEDGPRGVRGRSRRYISAHAYYHAMRADLARSAGDLETARDSLRLGLVYDPASVDLHLELARVLVDLGEGEPDRLVQRAIQLDPSRAASWAAKGDLLVRRGKKRGAERAYGRALRLEPRAPEGLHAAAALAGLYKESGRPDLARRTLRRMAELGGAEGRFLLASHDLEEGRLKEAEDGLLALSEVEDPELLRRVAERLAWLMRFESALRLYARSMEDEDQRHLVTDGDLRALLHLALLANDETAALRALERLSSRGSLAERRRAEASVLSANRASLLLELVSRRPSDSTPEGDLVLLGLEAAAGASDAALRVRASDPATPMARILLAEALLSREDQPGARRELDAMAGLDPAKLVPTLGVEMFERLSALMLRLHPASAPRFLQAVPSSVRARVLSARAALAAGAKLEAATQLADEEVESDADALVLLAMLPLGAERRERVERRVEAALTREPHRADLWRARARLHLDREDRARARVAMGRALFAEPNLREDVALVRNLLGPELSLGRRDSAERGIRP